MSEKNIQIEPISPKDITLAKKRQLPYKVIDQVNILIAEKWNGTESVFTLDKLVKRILDHTGIKNDDIFDKKYLDFEDIYREAGWIVDFDQRTYEAIFTFRKKR